jgi:hypothetical protein
VTWPTAETDLGPPVIGWLTSRGWDVYQEVEGPGGRADIVGTCGPLVAIVELKRSFGLDVVGQARSWLPWANMVWVAAPRPARASAARSLLLEVCDWKGIGVLEVSAPCHFDALGQVGCVADPALQRRASVDRLRRALRPEHKTMTRAGSASGGHWTPFKETCTRLRQAVATSPGITITDAIAAIPHHYANSRSARAHLVDLIRRGVIDGLELRQDGRRVNLYPKGAP